MQLRKLAFGAIAAAAMLAATPHAATAAPIVPFTFSTSSAFTPTGGATASFDSITNTSLLDFGNGLHLRYNNHGSANYLADGQSGPGALNTVVPLGSFDLFADTNVGPFTLPTGNTFALTIMQTNPTSPSGQFTSTLNGTIMETPNAGGGSIDVVFNDPTNLTLGGINYQLLLSGLNTLSLSVPNGVGVTSNTDLEAAVAAVPEPGSIMLFGTGLLAVARAARRRVGRQAI